jgi:hypothetical protein
MHLKPPTPAQVQEMFDKLDLNKDGEIDFEEFTVLIRNNLIALFKFHLQNLKDEKKLAKENEERQRQLKLEEEEK